jgi:hypothetical protein
MENAAQDMPIGSDFIPPLPQPGSGLNPPADPPLLAAFMPDPEDDDSDDGNDDTRDDVTELFELEAQKRLWVRTISAYLQTRTHESDPSGRVQLACDLAQIAACEAMARLMNQVCPRPDGG